MRPLIPDVVSQVRHNLVNNPPMRATPIPLVLDRVETIQPGATHLSAHSTLAGVHLPDLPTQHKNPLFGMHRCGKLSIRCVKWVVVEGTLESWPAEIPENWLLGNSKWVQET